MPKKNDKAVNAAITEDAPRRVNMKALLIGVFMVVAIAGSIFFAFNFVEDERQRELRSWQVRLGIIADSRVAVLNDWFSGNFAIMRELAENASLQIYMTELAMSEGNREGVTDEAAQASYLRNMLNATADRNGFSPPMEIGEVSANIERAGVAGIGLVDENGDAIVSTASMPPLNAKVRAAIDQALQGEPAVIDVHKGASNQPTIGFALPIYGVQDDGEGSKGIGAVVGLRIIGDDFFKLLQQPGETSQSSETFLARKTKASVEYISPLADGTGPLERSMAADTPELAAAYAVEKPGGFGIFRDYTGDEVLITSRALADVPWVLARKISRAEALAATETRLKTMLTVFVLITLGVTITLIAVWRHGSSLRATQAAENFRVTAERFENLSKFMNLISNSQPAAIVAVDGTTTYTYANEPAGRDAGIPPEDMRGKTMASVMGPIKAQVYAEINDKILSDFAVTEDSEKSRQTHINIFGDTQNDDGEDNFDTLQVIKSEHIPLRGDRDYPPGILMILEDITEITRERRRSERMLRQLINTLVSVVDRRDPFSAHHSTRVAEVAYAIAKEIGVDDMTAKTVEIAGSLMNLGKIFVPPELLTKVDGLSNEERNLIAGSYLVSVDLLSDVSFEGPVVDTIRDMGETVDGNGPLGKTGDEILLSGRILSVANAFVGMISARAYREALSFEKVSNILLEQSGTRFDRKPVSALINFLENRGGTDKWAHFRIKPTEHTD